MKLRHAISAGQFDRNFLDNLFDASDFMEMSVQNRKPPASANGKIMATLFYEPSTRTRLSFEAAMLRLGGKVISTENAKEFSSAAKGETIPDTVRIVGGYADVIVMRHHDNHAVETAAQFSPVPLINAGAGAGEHPTQALLDMYTIRKEKGRIDGMKIALVGDLLYGRTIHSLARLLPLYDGVEIFLVSPPNLRMPEEYVRHITDKKMSYAETSDFGVVEEADIIYMTRVQKERFASAGEYERMKDCYILDGDILERLKSDAVIMHPLPRTGELSQEIDADPRAAYFRQAQNGLYVRMALLDYVFRES